MLMRFHWGLGVGHAHSHGLMSVTTAVQRVEPDEQSNVRSLASTDIGRGIQDCNAHDSNQDGNRNNVQSDLDEMEERNGDDVWDNLDGGNGKNVDSHLDESNKIGDITNEMEGEVDRVESHNVDDENEEEEEEREEEFGIVLEELEELEELDMDEMYGDRDTDELDDARFSYN